MTKPTDEAEDKYFFTSKFLYFFFHKYIKYIQQKFYQVGFKIGFKKGFDQGLNEPRLLKLVDERIAISSIPHDNSIYGPEKFLISQEMKQLMISEVEQLSKQKLISYPTEEQWEMIFSDRPATSVIAGAGSGKSTTLVLRVVFMLCHLKIDINDITVVSFTTESCKELREKIITALSFDVWNQQISESVANNLKKTCKNLVKTFHAALYRVTKSQYKDFQFFENLKDNNQLISSDDENDVDNPIATSSNLSNKQKNLLMSSYRECFNTDKNFKEHVMSMLSIVCSRDIMNKAHDRDYSDSIIKTASERDLELTKLINKKWEHLLSEIGELKGIEFSPTLIRLKNRLPFYANGKVIATGMPIFLSMNGKIEGELLFDDEDLLNETGNGFKASSAFKVKQQIIWKHSEGNFLEINSTSGIERLAYRVAYNAVKDFKTNEAPRFKIQLKGELFPSDIVEAFHSQASFIESLGMENPIALSKMGEYFRQSTLEHHFASALAIFWPFFEEKLAAINLITFNRAFLQFGSISTSQQALPLHVVRSFTHLLVDEFQDISPQIVFWLRATQRRLIELEKSPTIMAIGDDWQSIYGWRGSAPEIFVNFNKHFPSHKEIGKAREYFMMQNFRSIAPIIEDGEKLLAPIEVKTEKNSIPIIETRNEDHGVRVITGANFGKPAGIVDEIITQLDWVNRLESSDKNKVLVLSRSRKVLNKVREELKKLGTFPGVSFFTFHGSKGLQGEVAILCDNCDYDMAHLFRNAAYSESGMFSQSYDRASLDEAYRLSYVAVTRGIRRVIWFVDEPKGAVCLLSNH